MKPDAARLPLLDVYRGIAVLLVMLFHYTGRHDKAYYGYFADVPRLEWGHYGVEFFFAISGFCIMMTSKSASTAGQFLLRRASRIFPALVAAALLTFCVERLFPLPGPGPTPADVVGSVFLLEEFGFRWVDGAYWSLLVEMKFYIAFAVVVYIVGRKNRKLGPLLGAILLMIGLIFLSNRFLWGNTVKESQKVAFNIFSFVHHLPWFLLGVGMYRLYQGMRTPATWIILGLASLGFFEALSKGRPLEAGLFVAVAGAIGLAMRFDDARVPRALTLLGLMSYPLYLVHQDIGYVIIRSTRGLGNDYLRIGAAIVTVVGLAWMLHRTVEFRFRRRFEAVMRPFFVGRSEPD